MSASMNRARCRSNRAVWSASMALAAALSGPVGLAGAQPTDALPQDPSTGIGGPGGMQRYFETSEGVEVYAGTDLVSRYFSRGVFASNKASVQPWAEVHIPFGSPSPVLGSDPTPTVSNPRFFVGTWHSIQDGGPGIGQDHEGSLSNWYEADAYAGLSVVIAERATASVRYNFYTSPGDSFEDVHEIDARLRIDDADYWRQEWSVEGFGTYPSVRATHELEVSGSGRERNGHVQLAITPSIDLGGTSPPVTLEVPLAAGFGLGSLYVTDTGREEAFGYARAGVGVSVPVDLLPEEYGTLGARLGVDAYMFEDDAFSGIDEDQVFVGSFGLRYGF